MVSSDQIVKAHQLGCKFPKHFIFDIVISLIAYYKKGASQIILENLKSRYKEVQENLFITSQILIQKVVSYGT